MSRFSLLLLDDDEAYLEDHAAEHASGGVRVNAVRGRLRLCTKNIFFEPESAALPILRFPVARLSRVGEAHGRCVLVAGEVAEMKRNGKDYPYVFVADDRTEHAFSFPHLGSNDRVLRLVAELFRCSRLPPDTSRAAVAALAARHRDAAKPFNLATLVDLNEEILLDVVCSRIKPFIVQPCRLVVTTRRLYLQPVDDLDGRKYVFDLQHVSQVFRRRHSLQEIGVEVQFRSGKKGVFLAFTNRVERERVHGIIWGHPAVSAMSRESVEAVTQQWQAGSMSNFDYLMFVNGVAGRTRQDLAQYPVFPWILTDYSSPTLNLSDPSVYRDLSKPIGALNPQRLEMFRARMRELPADGQEFLYGTHYSAPGYVLFYLVRRRPDLMLRLQNGKFDAPDRSFFSVAAAWASCYNSHTDVKELIPEFFSMPQMFENAQHLDLGTRQNGARVDDVELPPWCGHDPRRFVELHREALESPVVSANLHKWIDLIFGCKQRSKEADNLFYPVTYQGNVDVTTIPDERMRASLERQISEFGQTPKQVFFAPHPPRRALAKLDSFQVSSAHLDELIGSAVIVVKSPSRPASPAPKLAAAAAATTWNVAGMRAKRLLTLPRLHREAVTGVDCDASKLVSVARDGFLKVQLRQDADELTQSRAANISGGPLACCQLLSDDLVLVGGFDAKLHTYSVAYGKTVDSMLAHDDAVSALRWRNGRLVTGGWDTLVRLWNVRNDGTVERDPVFEVQELEGQVCSVDLASNGVFVAASSTNRVLLGDFRLPHKVVRVVDADADTDVACVRLLHDDGLRAVCGNYLWDLGKDVLEPFVFEQVTAVDASGAVAVLAAKRGTTLEFWDCGASERIGALEPLHGDRVACVCVRGDQLYAGTEKGQLMWL